MDTIDSLTSKIKTLSECAWDGKIKQCDIDQWLNNFRTKSVPRTKQNERQALHLLSQFVYFGSNEMRELIKALFRDLFRYPILKNIRQTNSDTTSATKLTRLFSHRVRETRFLGMGNPSESGCHLLYYFRQENCLPKDLFIHSHEIFTRQGRPLRRQFRDPSIVHYVFIDDFCGTGDQAIQYSTNVVDEMKLMNSKIQVSYYVLFATQSGLKNIKTNSRFDDVACVVDLDSSFRAFSSKSRYFTNCPEGITKSRSHKLCKTYGRRLWPSHSLGYRNSQLLMGFYHNTPDNTLPIFWYAEDAKVWRPIFKRYQKHYGEHD